MAYLNVTLREVVNLLKEELDEAENDTLIKELLKIVTKEIILWNGDIGDGKELKKLSNVLNKKGILNEN